MIKINLLRILKIEMERQRIQESQLPNVNTLGLRKLVLRTETIYFTELVSNYLLA